MRSLLFALLVCADQETGFGGNIMDPRIGTYFPESVKDSIKVLLDEWRKSE